MGIHNKWTAKEIDVYQTMAEQGYGYEAIARRLKRTPTAVRIKAKRLRYHVLTCRGTLSARDVAQLLGLGCAKIVTRWIEGYGLNARNAGATDRPLWRVSWDDLYAWLDNSDHWMAFDPARCADRALREHLIAIRLHHPRWLPIGAVAQRFGVSVHTVNVWIRRQGLAAVRYGNWWIREDVVAVWKPPYERSYAGRPKRIIADRESVVSQIRARRAQGEYLATIAAATNVSVSTVHRLTHA